MIENQCLAARKTALAVAISSAMWSPVGFAQSAPAEDAASASRESGVVLEEVIVYGVRASQAKAIDIKRNSANIVDSIVAEDIGKLPDMTITDSLQRITGVQISRQANEGTTLNIRGMPQVLTTLNGEQFLSPNSITGVQPDYSDIPAGLMSGVDVYKSQSASMLAGGISGIVDLKTLKPLSLDEGLTSRVRLELAQGQRSRKEMNEDGTQSTRNPDHNLNLMLGYNHEQRLAVYANLNHSSSNAANYSIWNNHRLAFLDRAGGVPTDPHDLSGSGKEDWYIVPEKYGASSRFVERDRLGGTLSAEYEVSPNLSVKGDVFFTRMDMYNREVNASFNGGSTPESWPSGDDVALYDENVFNVLQDTDRTEVVYGSTVRVPDGNGGMMERDIYAVTVADVWAADFQTNSINEIEKMVSVNTNLELNYTNHDNLEASVRYVYAKAERQQRKAQLQQGTPAWLWEDDDKDGKKDPVAGYHVVVDYTGKYPSFDFADDLSSSDLLDQYQGFAEGENTDGELNVLRADVSLQLDWGVTDSVDFGVRHGMREANHNGFYYVTPTGRYSNWANPRTPTDVQFLLLPGNLIWQRYPDWQKFDYSETNLSLIDIGGLQDNGFSGADTMSFTDFGPIQGFDSGVAALNPSAFDSPYEFMNRLYPGTRTVNNPGETYEVDEASTSAHAQLNFSDDHGGFLGIPYQGNFGVKVVQTNRTVVKSNVPEVLDMFNSIGYDDWQKLAYVYDSDTTKVSFTDVLPSLSVNLFPTESVILRVGVAQTMTRNDLSNVGSSLTLWYGRCPKTDQGEPVLVPSGSGDVQDDVGCVGGGEDRGSPDIKPWRATVYNTSAEWYFAENAILGAGLFMIEVDTAIESLQVQREFDDMDGIDRDRRANIWTTQNASASDLWGLEVGYKQPFTFLPWDYLNATGIEANYTYSNSESAETDVEGNAFPLPSNSEHQANLILWYDKDGLNVRAAYNWRSDEYIGRFNLNSNVAVLDMGQWLESTGYLDLSMNYKINDFVTVYLNGTNLTNQSRHNYAQYEEQFHSLWVQERRFSGGISLSF